MTTITVPASTSNLGAGFDTLGLALQLYLTLRVEPLDAAPGTIEMELSGEGADALPASATNLVARAFLHAAEREDVSAPAVRLAVSSQIPIARGLGSSGAAVAAGISAFEAVTGRSLSADRLMELCYEIEGHCENAAASLFGGIVTCCTRPESAPIVLRRDWPEEVRIVVVIPETTLATAEARRAIPATVPVADAVFNIQRAALLHAAISERRWDLLWDATRDRIHQPYREPLLPGFSDVLALEPGDGLVGVALSGAGSAVVALATGNFDQVGQRVAACFRRAGVDARVEVLDIDAVGRRISAT